MRLILTTAIGLTLFVSICAQATTKTEAEYLQSFQAWETDLMKSRIKYLKLTALCRLNDKVTFLGSDEDCDCTIDIQNMPDVLGSFSIKSDQLIFTPTSDVEVMFDDRILDSDTVIELYEYGDSELFVSGQLSWKIISRGDHYYIRAYDAQNPAIISFPGFEQFPVNRDMIFHANFSYFDNPEVSEVDSRIGVSQDWKFIGRLSFEYHDRDYSLDVSEGGFTMVRDLTSGDETYGGGRYMYVDLPSDDGAVVLDFNRLYNPPCAFSEYTTCLLPPAQNTLNFRIEAGETIEFREGVSTK